MRSECSARVGACTRLPGTSTFGTRLRADAGGNAWIAITPVRSHSVIALPVRRGRQHRFPFIHWISLASPGCMGKRSPESPQALEGCEATGPTGASDATGATEPLVRSTAMMVTRPTAAAPWRDFEGGFVAENVSMCWSAQSVACPAGKRMRSRGRQSDVVYLGWWPRPKDSAMH